MHGDSGTLLQRYRSRGSSNNGTHGPYRRVWAPSVVVEPVPRHVVRHAPSPDRVTISYLPAGRLPGRETDHLIAADAAAVLHGRHPQKWRKPACRARVAASVSVASG